MRQNGTRPARSTRAFAA